MQQKHLQSLALLFLLIATQRIECSNSSNSTPYNLRSRTTGNLDRQRTRYKVKQVEKKIKQHATVIYELLRRTTFLEHGNSQEVDKLTEIHNQQELDLRQVETRLQTTETVVQQLCATIQLQEARLQKLHTTIGIQAGFIDALGARLSTQTTETSLLQQQLKKVTQTTSSASALNLSTAEATKAVEEVLRSHQDNISTLYKNIETLKTSKKRARQQKTPQDAKTLKTNRSSSPPLLLVAADLSSSPTGQMLAHSSSTTNEV